MQQYITPDRIANSIQQNTLFEGATLVIEGYADYIFFNKFINKANCQIKIAFGNLKVIEVIEILNTRNYTKALGIIDSDFKRLDKEEEINRNVILTDYHDIEMQAICSPAFDILINSYANEEKITSFEKEIETSLSKYFQELARPLAYLKWANKKNKLGLIFKPLLQDGNELNISNFIPYKTLQYSGHKSMIETVINYSRNKSDNLCTVEEALREMGKLINPEIDDKQLCNGHDICTIISLSLRKKIGTYNANECDPKQIEKELILAYDSSYFRESILYSEIKNWEANNNSIVLFF